MREAFVFDSVHLSMEDNLIRLENLVHDDNLLINIDTDQLRGAASQFIENIGELKAVDQDIFARLQNLFKQVIELYNGANIRVPGSVHQVVDVCEVALRLKGDFDIDIERYVAQGQCKFVFQAKDAYNNDIAISLAGPLYYKTAFTGFHYDDIAEKEENKAKNIAKRIEAMNGEFYPEGVIDQKLLYSTPKHILLSVNNDPYDVSTYVFQSKYMEKGTIYDNSTSLFEDIGDGGENTPQILDIIRHNNDANLQVAYNHVQLGNIVKDTATKLIRYLLQANKALEDMHQKKWAHNDIKSDNIMIDENDDVQYVDLDFIAKATTKSKKTDVANLARSFLHIIADQNALGIVNDWQADDQVIIDELAALNMSDKSFLKILQEMLAGELTAGEAYDKCNKLINLLGENVNDFSRRTIIDEVADDNLDKVRYFLNIGANIYSEDIHGQTLLNLAISSVSEDMVEYLCLEGIDVELRNIVGNTPLQYAVNNGNNADIKRILVNFGADQSNIPIANQVALGVDDFDLLARTNYLIENYHNRHDNLADFRDRQKEVVINITKKLNQYANEDIIDFNDVDKIKEFKTLLESIGKINKSDISIDRIFGISKSGISRLKGKVAIAVGYFAEQVSDDLLQDHNGDIAVLLAEAENFIDHGIRSDVKKLKNKVAKDTALGKFDKYNKYLESAKPIDRFKNIAEHYCDDINALFRREPRFKEQIQDRLLREFNIVINQLIPNIIDEKKIRKNPEKYLGKLNSFFKHVVKIHKNSPTIRGEFNTVFRTEDLDNRVSKLIKVITNVNITISNKEPLKKLLNYMEVAFGDLPAATRIKGALGDLKVKVRPAKPAKEQKSKVIQLTTKIPKKSQPVISKAAIKKDLTTVTKAVAVNGKTFSQNLYQAGVIKSANTVKHINQAEIDGYIKNTINKERLTSFVKGLNKEEMIEKVSTAVQKLNENPKRAIQCSKSRFTPQERGRKIEVLSEFLQSKSFNNVAQIIPAVTHFLDRNKYPFCLREYQEWSENLGAILKDRNIADAMEIAAAYTGHYLDLCYDKPHTNYLSIQ